MKSTIVHAALLLLSATATSTWAADSTPAPPPTLVMEEFMIPSGDAGIELFVRNKHPKDMKKFPEAKILLFVHGSTYPAETSFDLQLDGVSWMEYIAQRGYDVYLVDVRGYGRSTRPPEMSQPPENNPPIVTTDVAIKDVGSAVDFIRKRRGAAKINLLGWSWGTTMMGAYTAANPERVHRLVLYAPQWLRDTPTLIGGDGKLGAYRSVAKSAAKDRWLKGVAADQQASLIPYGWFEKWVEATWATDPIGASQTSPVLRAPNGTLQDTRDFWSSGKPYYDPGKVTVPTLIVHAEWDADNPSALALGIYAQIKHAPWKRLVEIGEGTHTVLMEKNRMQLFREVQLFLDEPAIR
jgi:pimeloyl-ACP methyl ester carboxylesterase